MITSHFNVRYRYYLPLSTALLTVLSFIAIANAGGFASRESRFKTGTKKILMANPSVAIDHEHEQRIRFASDHGVVDPDSLVSAVSHSPMANLLISVAIEESRGDPVAVGSAGERGAWQVKASDWGTVPHDLHGQAGQAERIIRGLMIHSKGNKKKALARYNGGTIPPGKSYRYAERILQRVKHLQVTANRLPRNYTTLRSALLDIPGNSRIVTSFFHVRNSSNGASFLS